MKLLFIIPLVLMSLISFPSWGYEKKNFWIQIKVQPIPNGQFPYAYVEQVSRSFSTQKRCEDDLLSEALSEIEEAKVIEKHDQRHIIETVTVPETGQILLFNDYQCLKIVSYPILEGD